MNTKKLAILNTFSLGFHIIISYFVQNKKLSSMEVGEVSAKYDSLFAPAGLTFAIWGVIYISLIAFCIYHLYKAFNSDKADQVNSDTNSIGWLFTINNIATGLWLIAWVNEALLLSVFLMLLQLISLILISIRAHISNPERPILSKLFTQFPLSIYFGWITIATIANISAYLISVSWNGFNITENYWVIIMIGAATLVSLFIILVRRNFFYGMVVLWALYGIILKRNALGENQYESIVHAAWAGFIIVLLALIIRLINRQNVIPSALR